MFKQQGSPKNQTLDSVTSEIMSLLQAAMRNFKSAAEALEKLTAGDERVCKDVQAFIKWCRFFITGVVVWSLESNRYGMAACKQDDCSVKVVLLDDPSLAPPSFYSKEVELDMISNPYHVATYT